MHAVPGVRVNIKNYGMDEENMKYVGIYWTLFAPLMKKSIRKRFSKELADRAIRQGKSEYRGLLYSLSYL